MTKIKWLSFSLVVFVCSSGYVFAQSCADYPFGNGMNVDEVEGGVRMIATASVGVSFDDVDAVNDARTEASLAARAMIVRFLQEEIKSDESVRRAVAETRSMQGDARQVRRDETIQRVRELASSASGLLRGVVPLGECYTQGRELRVSVGLKPETIAQAGGMAGQMSRSIASQPVPSSSGAQGGNPSLATPPPAQAQNPGNVMAPNRVPGYSDSQRLNRF